LWAMPLPPLLKQSINLTPPHLLDLKKNSVDATQALRTLQSGVYLNGNQPPIDIVIVGSSHARMFCPPLILFAKENQLTTLSLAVAGLEITRDKPRRKTRDAIELNQLRRQIIQKNHPQVVILLGHWVSASTKTNLVETLGSNLRMISQNTDHLLVMGQIPDVDIPPHYGKNVVKYSYAQLLTHGDVDLKATMAHRRANHIVQEIVEKVDAPNITYIDLSEHLRDENNNLAPILNNNLIFLDRGHVNDVGADFVFQAAFAPILRKIFLESKAQP